MRFFWFIALVLLSPTLGEAKKRCRDVEVKLGEAQVSLETFQRHVLLPVLRESNSEDRAKIEIDAKNNLVYVRSDRGDYLFELTDNPNDVYPHAGLPDVVLRKGRFHARVKFQISDALENPLSAQGRVRSAFRADLHPHVPKDVNNPQPSVLSYPQRDALAALIAMEQNKGLMRGLFVPVGMGKTIISAKYVAALSQYHRDLKTRGWGKPPKILFTVENNYILDKTVEAFERELGLTKISRVYGDGRKESIDPKTQMIAITRSSYFNRKAAIHKLLTSDPEQPWIIVVDEAHHIEKEEGQYKQILDDLRPQMDVRHRVLLLSSFFGYRDKGLMSKELQGNVHGAFLNREEAEALRRGERLAELCRAQYFRGMKYGYLSPMHGLEVVREIGGVPISEVLSGASWDGDTRQVHIYKDLLKDIAKRVNYHRVSNVRDRGVFFVDTTARADEYAKELSKLLGVEVRAFHSRPSADPETLDWFSDKGEFDTKGDRQKHKYIVAVDILKEGVDISSINLVVLLRQYGDNPAGFANLIQNLGRASRNHAHPDQFKPAFRVIDYSGATRWLHDGLAQVMVEPLREGGTHPKGYVPHLAVGKEILTPLQFQQQYFELFPEDATFAAQYPNFDLEIFHDKTIPVLRAQATQMGVPNWALNFATKDLVLRLAEQLPDSKEKTALIKRLSDDEIWGWHEADGKDALRRRGPAEKLYRAIHEIAALFHVTARGRDLPILELNDPKVMRIFLDALAPMDKPIEDPKQIRTFLDDKNGALAVIMGATRQAQGIRQREFLAKELMVEMLRRLPQTAARDARIRQMEDLAWWQWSRHDGIRDMRLTPEEKKELSEGKTRSLWGYNRVYRAWRSVAHLWNEAHPDRSVRLDLLHKREETERLMEMIFPLGRIPDLAGESYDLFRNPANGAATLAGERAPELGIKRYSVEWGTREMCLALAKRIPESPESLQLILDLQNPKYFDWVANDGASMKPASTEPATRRFYRGLHAIAKLTQKAFPDSGVDPAKVHTREGLDALLDQLSLGFVIPYIDAETVAQFSGHNSRELYSTARDELDIRTEEWRKEFGPKQLALAMAEKLPPSPEKDNLVAALKDDAVWGWMLSDGQNLTARAPLPTRRTLRAIYAIATLQNKYGKETFDFEKLVMDPRELESLVELLIP